MTVQALIQATSTIESLANPIDQLAVFDAEIKRLEAITKQLKADISNTFGEGKHRGEKYGVSVLLCNTSKVDYKALLAELGATPEQIAKHTTTGASIRVTATA
jgi:uncharacterized protein (UPF0335 family)